METFHIYLELNYVSYLCQRQRPRIHRALLDSCDD